jgi:hypothetical protein
VPKGPCVVYPVPDDAPAKTELMGTKPKFWFARDEELARMPTLGGRGSEYAGR